jgi:hypothetical protein
VTWLRNSRAQQVMTAATLGLFALAWAMALRF